MGSRLSISYRFNTPHHVHTTRDAKYKDAFPVEDLIVDTGGQKIWELGLLYLRRGEQIHPG